MEMSVNKVISSEETVWMFRQARGIVKVDKGQ